MPRVRVIVGFMLLCGLAFAPGVTAQTLEAERLTVGGALQRPDGTSLRVQGLGTSGGTLVLIGDGDGDVFGRVLGTADIPSQFTRRDVAEAISAAWTFSGGITGPLSVTTSLASPIGTFATRVSTPEIISASGPITLAPVGQGLVNAGSKVFAPSTPYSHKLGTFDLPWLSADIAELNVKTLVATKVMSTIGGRVLVAPTTTLALARVGADTSFTFRDNNFVNGDVLYLEANGHVEFVRVNSTPAAANLITNNNFLLGSITGWTSGGTGGAFVGSAFASYADGFALRIAGQTGALFATNSQYALLPSTTYTMCMYAQKDDGSAVIGSELAIYDGNAYGATTITQEGAWYRACRTFTTAASLAFNTPAFTWTAAPVWNLDSFSLETGSVVTPWSGTKTTATVVRNLDGSGANDWPAGTAVVNTGQAGNGFIDLYSTRGVKAGTEVGPTIVGNVRLSSTYNDWAPRWAIGNLNGLYGVVTDTYGVGIGNPAGANSVTTGNSWKLRHGTTDKIRLDGTTGDIDLTGNILLSTGGNIASTGNFSLTSANGLTFAPSASSITNGRAVRWSGGTGTSAIWQQDSAGTYGIVLQGNSTIGGRASVYLLNNGWATFDVDVGVRPASDGTKPLGSASNRWSTANFALASNAAPTYVVVNKGGGGSDATSALGFFAGYSGTFSVIKNASLDVCSVTYVVGLLASTTC